MEIMDYAIPDDVKKQLGTIVREIRKYKLQDVKNLYLIEMNPYTKENFCENNQICHYHTLTKLENELIKEDYIYHTLLKKLDLYYQVNEIEHNYNMNFIHSLSKDLLVASEYINDEIIMKIKKEINKTKFDKDCIADFYIRLIELLVDLQLLSKIDQSRIELIEKLIDFYEDIYKGLALQCVGIYNLNTGDLEAATEYFLRAKEVYDELNVSKGLINSYLIPVYFLADNYLEGVAICNEMEDYYQKTNNFKRLMHVYNYLSDYYLLINAYDYAEEYFNKSIEIINENVNLERFKYYLYFNWGLRCFKDYRLDDALKYFEMSNEYCFPNNSNKLQIINYILIILIKLNGDSKKIEQYYQEGEKIFTTGNEYSKAIFKYFRYKLQNNKYYRRYALEKIIPKLKDSKERKEILIFFYEDLYK